jgi:hypothetical protein
MLRKVLFTLALLGVSTTFYGQLSIEALSYSTRCNGSSTGMVDFVVTGAIGEVTYFTNVDLEALPAGDYALTAQDEGGQEAFVSFTILDHPASCGCTYPTAFNFVSSADVDDGSCVFSTDQSCLADIVPDGVVGTNDLLQLLVEFGVVCE